MSIFRRHSEPSPDLSDQALTGEAAAAPAEEAAAGEEAPAAPPEAETAPAATLSVEPDPAQEQQWQEAARSVAGHWPQIREDLPALVGRMKAISERYGDPTLWQRSPAGIMREAAVELYGMPARPDAGALAQAVRAAHEQGRRAAAERSRTLAGLAPPQVSRSAPPPLTEEEKILRDMRQARKGRLF